MNSNYHRLLVILLFVPSIILGQGSVWQEKKSSWLLLTDAQRKEVFSFNEGYKDYLRVAKTELSSTREVIRLAKQAGFAEFAAASQVKAGAKLIVNNRDRAVALMIVGSEPIMKGSRLIGTHHDSPRLDVKARPATESEGYVLFKTIFYGGIKKYQWANVPLALVGRIDTKDGRTVDVNIGLNEDDPLFMIPDAAPHSDSPLRSRTYTSVFEGEELMPLIGSVPGEKGVFAEVLRYLFQRYNITEEDFVSGELSFVPVAPPRDAGVDRGLPASAGQDDRLSSYLAVRALMDLKQTPRYTAIAYLTDNEESGSNNNTGASSSFLNGLYARLVAAEQGKEYSDIDLFTALRNAKVISADVNDAVNPIFPKISEPLNAARLGYGVAIKRYGEGFDANSEFIAETRKMLDEHNIPYQTHTYRVDTGRGGTIGGFLSKENMEVIDLGVPILSMHSPYELSSKVDVWNFYRAMRVFYESR